MTLQLSEAWIALLAALVPFLTAAATKPSASNKLRAALAIIASGVLAGVNALATGETDASKIAGAFVAALVVAMTTYHSAAKHLDVNARVLPKVGL